MKKELIICISILVMTVNVFSQNANYGSTNTSSNTHDNNEIRLNVATPIFGLPEINYERYISDNMGVGLAASFSLEKPKDMNIRSIFLPYYRIYFGEKKASGFFIEGNMAVVGQKDEYSSYSYTYDATQDAYIYSGISYQTRSSTNFGCGAACGFKFLTRNGVIGELCLGAGRIFGNTITDVYPRLGVCIGKRF